MTDADDSSAGPAVPPRRGQGRRATGQVHPVPPSYTLRDLAILAFAHLRLILIVALIPVTAGVIAAIVSEKEYSAESLLLLLVTREQSGDQAVTSSGPAVLSVEGLKAVEGELRILRSDEVIEAALDAVGVTGLFPEIDNRRLLGLLPPLTGEARRHEAIDRFSKQLKASVEAGSNVIRVVYDDPDPDLASDALTALVKAYLERHREIFDNPRSLFLTTETERFRDQLRGIEEQIRSVKTGYGIVDTAQDILLATNQADVVVQRQRQTSERRAAVLAEIATAESRLAALPETVFDFAEQTNQAQNNDDRNVLLKLKLERDRLAANYAPDYPLIRDIDRQIETVRRAMKGGDQPWFDSYRKVRNPSLDFLTNHLLALRIEADALDQQLQELERQGLTSRKRLDELLVADGQLRELERTRSVIDGIYREYATRSEAARIEEQSAKERASNVRVVQWPSPPVEGSSMRLAFLIAGLFGGVLLGGAAGFLANWLRQSYLVPKAAERNLRLHSLAAFADAPAEFETPGAQLELIALAATLRDVTLDGQTLDLLQFVAVSAEDGQLGLVRALGRELALNRGLETLIIDLTGSGRSQLSGIGRGADEADRLDPEAAGATIKATQVPHLWATADAPQAALGSLRTSVDLLESHFALLRRTFDVILVIAPPFFANPLGRRLGALADANILVLRAGQTRAPAAAQLTETLLSAGGDLLGFIMTGRRFYIPASVMRWL